MKREIVILLALFVSAHAAWGACPDFAAAVNYAAGAKPVGVAVGDFNRDGQADLAVANSNAASISLLLGNGGGTLTPAISYAVGNAASPPAITSPTMQNISAGSTPFETRTFRVAVRCRTNGVSSRPAHGPLAIPGAR